jgi:hypothetical protein
VDAPSRASITGKHSPLSGVTPAFLNVIPAHPVYGWFAASVDSYRSLKGKQLFTQFCMHISGLGQIKPFTIAQSLSVDNDMQYGTFGFELQAYLVFFA